MTNEAQKRTPRRPHHKSRTGCVQCKQRKIKCDEQKPTCKKCDGYGAPCSFLQTHPQRRASPTVHSMTVQSMLASPALTATTYSSPAPAPLLLHPTVHPSALPKEFTMLDLELLYLFVTETLDQVIDFRTGIQTFRIEVVKQAFIYPFLMHEILSLAALHLGTLHPERRAICQHASNAHAATGLALFHPEIANLTAKNCHACFAFSSTTFMHAWAAQDLDKPSTLFFSSSNSLRDVDAVDIKWVKLHRGTNGILEALFPIISQGPLASLMAEWVDLDPNRADPLPPEDEFQFNDLAKAWKDSTTLSATETEALDDASSKLRRSLSMLYYFPKRFGKLPCIMAWFSWVTDEYLRMLEEKVPEALLVGLYVCVAIKWLDGLWSMKGKAQNLLRTILDVLGDGYERWTKWPIEKVLGGHEFRSRDDAPDTCLERQPLCGISKGPV